MGRLVEIAREILDGRRGVLDGARVLSALLYRCGLDRDDDLILIISVDSETDRFPLGEVRKRWDPNVLAELDSEIQASEDFYRERIRRGCNLIISRFDYPDDVDGDVLRR